MEFVQEYVWILWVALILVFVIIEVATTGLWFAMFAIGSLAGLIISLFGLPFWLALLVAAVVSLLLIFAVRPPLFRLLKRGGDHRPTNVEALHGIAGVVELDVNGSPGLAKLANGETWTIKAANAATDFSAGDHVVVTAIHGATAIVEPAERK